MIPRVTMRAALDDPRILGLALQGDSWRVWRAMLVATAGEALSASERRLFAKFTGRAREPLEMIDEAAFVVGRRGGKDRAASVLASYIASCCDHPNLSPGERGVVLLIGADQRQAVVTLGYITAAFEQSPVLRKLIAAQTADTLSLTNGIDIEVRAASFRKLRGITCVAVIATEIAFWMTDDSANPDVEILNAVRPTLATTHGPLILISSPYAKRGVLYETHKRHFGPEGDPLVLVAQGMSREFNPTLSQRVVDRAYQNDPASAAAEYGARFRSDIESYISREAVEACVAAGVRERAPVEGVVYAAFTDPAGGSGKDAFTLAIGHREKARAVLDLVREVRPPFSPEAVVDEFCTLLKSYRVATVRGDRYAGEWPREQFRKRGVRYFVSEKVKSDLYIDFLPAINSGALDLLDHERMLNQLCGLERRTARSGKDSIDHAPKAHDDVANAVAGVVSELLAARVTPTVSVFGPIILGRHKTDASLVGTVNPE